MNLVSEIWKACRQDGGGVWPLSVRLACNSITDMPCLPTLELSNEFYLSPEFL
jgi:hypothetical protein